MNDQLKAAVTWTAIAIVSLVTLVACVNFMLNAQHQRSVEKAEAGMTYCLLKGIRGHGWTTDREFCQ